MTNPYPDILDLTDEMLDRIERLKRSVKLHELDAAPLSDVLISYQAAQRTWELVLPRLQQLDHKNRLAVCHSVEN